MLILEYLLRGVHGYACRAEANEQAFIFRRHR